MSTPVGDSILSKEIYRGCVVPICGREILVDLIAFDMVDFNIIFEMDWLHSCYDSVDCRNSVVQF